MAVDNSSFRKFFGTLAFLLGLPGFMDQASGAFGDPERPNIIFILADDLGWTELGCYGNHFNETPNLDRLAREGMRFTHAYAAAPVCSPYRAAFHTGQYPARLGITDYLRPDGGHLPTRHITIAEMLKRTGYATAMVGKWHLTGYRYHGAEREVRATDHGFDEEIISEIKGVGNGINFFPYVHSKHPVPWVNVGEKRMPGNEFLVDRMNLEAVEFIERNKKGPFFIYLSHYATHTILNGKPELVDKYLKKHPAGESTRSKCRICQEEGKPDDPGNHWAGDHNPHLAAMLESIDDGVGRILEKLDRLGLAENSVIIFTSDNGGEAPNVTSNAPLRGGKSQLYEGGIRVPMIVRWPGVVPKNVVCSEPTMNIDFYPTLLDLAGLVPDRKQHLDGRSLVPVFKNPQAPMIRRALYWHYPLEKPHFLGGRSAGAIREGDWKLIEFFDSGELELYNLAEDRGEERDLLPEYREEAESLRKRLADWRGSTTNKPTN